MGHIQGAIFGLTKYIRQIVQYLVIYRISVFGIRLGTKYIWLIFGQLFG